MVYIKCRGCVNSYFYWNRFKSYIFLFDQSPSLIKTHHFKFLNLK